MENYEQHNEVTTSFNNLKHYECKFYPDDKKDTYRFKMDETQSTPFSVKDILNNPSCNYERSDIWKYNERDKRAYDYEPMYHQPQSYCPEYFGQVYPNIPHNNIDYWTQEVYHDHKIEDYYNYNPYCHSLYNQNYEYADMTASGLEAVKEKTVNVDTTSPAVVGVPDFVSPDLLPKDASPKKNNSKLYIEYLMCLDVPLTIPLRYLQGSENLKAWV